jgi:hypothetical protein
VNEFLKERILRRLEALPDDRVLQVLDYIEFLESRYAARSTAAPNVLQKLAEEVQNTLRASNVSAQAISETMKLMSKAAGVMSGVRAAAESVATDVKRAVVPPEKRETAPESTRGHEQPPKGGTGQK